MNKRAMIVQISVFAAAMLLIGYIGYIMLFPSHTVSTGAVGRRTRSLSLYSLKGTIYDRNMKPITNGTKVYYLLVDPRNFDRTKIGVLARLTDSDVKELGQRLQKESVFVLQARQKPIDMRGVQCFDGVGRYGGVASHLIGYVDRDLTGVSGLEKCFDRQLSYFQTRGILEYQTDGAANPMSGLGLSFSAGGNEYKGGVVTTLDKDLQIVLQDAMVRHISSGAGVVLDIQSGEILALCSVPDFDASNVQNYLSSAKGELLNRALGAQTVGSVFKIVVAAAALEQGMDAFEYDCTGSIDVGGRAFGCHNRDGHGKMNLEDAFCQSCNCYFIALGQMLGGAKIAEMAHRLGFGDKIRITEGLSAAGGQLGDISSAQGVANFSIGQGGLLASPVQIARLLALCGNGGYLVSPGCLKGFWVEQKLESEQWISYRSAVVKPAVAERLRQLCVAVVQRGTGKQACPEGGTAGGKTASAQTGVFRDDGTEILNTYFAGFFPAEGARYAIAIFAEDGKSGGATNAPVFREICTYLLTK